MTSTLLSVRMTVEEKARLEAEADHAGMKLSAYVRRQLLGPDRPKPRSPRPAQKLDRPYRVPGPATREQLSSGMTAYERLLAEQRTKRRWPTSP